MATIKTVITLYSAACSALTTTSSISAIKLDNLYYGDATLSRADSPYKVESNVIIPKDVTLTIENGVDIIFINDAKIIIRGSIIVGCNEFNASLNSHRGLFDTMYTHIHGQDKKGTMLFEDKSRGQFCNVLFESLQYLRGGDHRSGQAESLLFDNCEFSSCNTYISSMNNIISDSWFHDGSNIFCSGRTCAIYNCLMDASYILFDGGYIKGFIYNTDIMNVTGKRSYCIEVSEHARVRIENSTISNCTKGIISGSNTNIISSKILYCSTGIYNNYGNVTILSSAILKCSISIQNGRSLNIKFSNISNSEIAVQIFGTYSNDEAKININYNNFVNNKINIDNQGSYDRSNLNYNYFGTNTTNQSIIASKVMDICDNGYSNGLITFWPWLIKPYINMDSIYNEIYTFNFSGCASIKIAKSYIITTSSSSFTATETEFVSLPVKSVNASNLITIIIVILVVIIIIGSIYLKQRIELNKNTEKMEIDAEIEGLIELETLDTKDTESQSLIAI